MDNGTIPTTLWRAIGILNGRINPELTDAVRRELSAQVDLMSSVAGAMDRGQLVQPAAEAEAKRLAAKILENPKREMDPIVPVDNRHFAIV